MSSDLFGDVGAVNVDGGLLLLGSKLFSLGLQGRLQGERIAPLRQCRHATRNGSHGPRHSGRYAAWRLPAGCRGGGYRLGLCDRAALRHRLDHRGLRRWLDCHEVRNGLKRLHSDVFALRRSPLLQVRRYWQDGWRGLRCWLNCHRVRTRLMRLQDGRFAPRGGALSHFRQARRDGAARRHGPPGAGRCALLVTRPTAVPARRCAVALPAA